MQFDEQNLLTLWIVQDVPADPLIEVCAWSGSDSMNNGLAN
jgi:hypothetical protein